MIIAGDIGGTKSNLAVFEREGDKLRKRLHKKYPSREVASFEEMLRSFMKELGADAKCDAACFGVAGPVIGRSVHPTNLDWPVDADAAGKILGTNRVQLVNDMEASFAGVDALEEKELVVLQAGEAAKQATQALLAAGTGLGESFRVWDGKRYRVVPSEGGHSDFAPRTDKEIELLRYMKKKRPWNDVESVISGRGFLLIHQFLDANTVHSSFEDSSADPAVEITGNALDGSCKVCVETMDMWVGLYGAEAGNLAVKTLARGGIFVAGGIAGKILPKLTSGLFVEAFLQKAELQDVLKRIPITVVLDPEAPVVGAAATAAQLL